MELLTETQLDNLMHSLTKGRRVITITEHPASVADRWGVWVGDEDDFETIVTASRATVTDALTACYEALHHSDEYEYAEAEAAVEATFGR